MKSLLFCLVAVFSRVESFHRSASPARLGGIGGTPPLLQQQRRQQQPPLLPSSHHSPSSVSSSTTRLEMTPLLTSLRGGAVLGGAAGVLRDSLVSSGPAGMAGLAALAVSVLTPLTLYRQAYVFSVGYSGSVAAMGWALSRSFDLAEGGPASAVVRAMVVYGVRLASHLLLREATVPSKRETLLSMDKTPRLKRIPFAATSGLLYAFMCTPALYLCRMEGSLTGVGLTLSNFFAQAAWFGAIVEAWADAQKFWNKRGKDGAEEFSGPTTWLYGASRHPNYLGEITFWLSVLGSGLPAILANRTNGLWLGTVLPGICSVLGAVGIVGVMLMATKRLGARQEDKYGGQELFDDWKDKTSKLFPDKPSSVAAAVLPFIVVAWLASYLSQVKAPWLFT